MKIGESGHSHIETFIVDNILTNVMADINIQNIVASASIADKLDLKRIEKVLPNTKYTPNIFPGLVLRPKEVKASFLLFRSGKAVCTGAKTVEDIEKSIKEMMDMLSRAGFDVKDKPDINVQNIVASGDFHGKLDLIETAVNLGLENVEYEPEIFPGMVYRRPDLGVVLLLFSSGRIVCTGAKRPEQAFNAFSRIKKEMVERGLLY